MESEISQNKQGQDTETAIVFDPRLLDWFQNLHGRAGLVASLTPREREVLACLGEDLSEQAIADRLNISPRTVKKHTAHINDRLDTANRTEAALLQMDIWLSQGERKDWFDALQKKSPLIGSLTKREQEVLTCLGRALENKEIASELGISAGAVKNYIIRIMNTLGVERRTELALIVRLTVHESGRLNVSAPAP